MKLAFILALCIPIVGVSAPSKSRSSRIKELTERLAIESDNASKDEIVSELLSLDAKEAVSDLVAFMVKEAQKGDLWMAEIAAGAVDSLGADPAVPKLKEYMNHSKPTVRLLSCIALRRKLEVDSLAELRKLITLSGTEELEEISVTAIGEIRQRKATVVAMDLVEIVKSESHRTQKANAAAEALRDLDLKDVMGKLESALSDSNQSVRYFAAEALFNAKRKEALATLKGIYAEVDRTKYSELKELAARSLLQAQDKDLIPLYLKILSDEKAEVRKFAAEILGEMRVKDAGPQLIDGLDSQESDFRAAVVSAIDMINDPKLATKAAEKMIKTKIYAFNVPEIRNLNYSVGTGVICLPLKEMAERAIGNSKKWGFRWLDAARCTEDAGWQDTELAELRSVLDAKESCDLSIVEPNFRSNLSLSPKDSRIDGCLEFTTELVKAYKLNPTNDELVGLIGEALRVLPPSAGVDKLRLETSGIKN